MSNTSTSPIAGLRIAVIGTGVVGLATAYALARRGAHVHVFDRHDGPARGTSFANGAQLSYAYTDAMAGPSTWKQLPSMLLGHDRCFRARNSLDLDYFRWGLSFLRNTTAARLDYNTLQVLGLANESRGAMEALLERHPIHFEHQIAGKLHVYYNNAGLPAAQAMIRTKQDHGVRQRLVDPEEAMQIEPALRGATGMVGAVYTPDEAVGDPWLFATGLLNILTRDYGVQTHFGCHIEGLRRDAQRWHLRNADGEPQTFDDVVVCTGVDAARLLRPLGIIVPVMAVKGYSFTAPCGSNAPATSITDTARKLVFARLGSSIRVAGLVEVNVWDPTPEPSRVADLVDLARASLPHAADYSAISHQWAGLRPVTPTSTPIIAQAGAGLTLNIGHGTLGWTLAMGSAERVASLFKKRR